MIHHGSSQETTSHTITCRIVMVWLFFLLPHFAWASTCPTGEVLANIFSVNPHLGHLESNLAKRKILEVKVGESVYALGRGMDGEVFRITSSDTSTSRILKFQTLDSAIHDFLALTWLGELKFESKSFRVIRPKIRAAPFPLPEMSAWYKKPMAFLDSPDLRGRDLFDVLADVRASESTKQALRKQYHDYISALSEQKITLHKITPDLAADHYPTKYIDFRGSRNEYIESVKQQPEIHEASVHVGCASLPSELLAHCPRGGVRITFIIKSDNFLVNESGQIVMIDPS